MRLSVEDRRERLAQWSVLSDEERALAGMPLSRAALAEVLDTSDKTLQRDEARPEHTARVEALRSRRLVQAGGVDAGAALAAVEAARDLSLESFDVMVPRAISRLVSISESGDREATKALLGLPQVKAWLDLQVREQSADYSDTPVEELAREVCELAGAEPLAAALRAAGWTCEPPAVAA